MKHQHYNQGSALIITLVLFVAISLSIALGLVVPVLHASRIAEDSLQSKKSYFTAESGVEDVIYRLRSGKQVSSSETISIGNSEATTTVTTLGGTQKQIESIGDAANRNRTVSVVLSQGVGATFSYGIQVGLGGVSMSGSSGIDGSIFSNGDVFGTASTFVSGSVYAANGSALTADQQNGETGTPPASIIFGNATATQDYAQSFTVSTDTALSKVQLYIKKIGLPANATVRITANSAGSPSATTIASGTLSASLVTTAYGWVAVPFSSNPSLTPGTTYWFVVDTATSSSNYYTVGANANGYAEGTAKAGRYGSSWNATTPANLDSYFMLYVGGQTSRIYGESANNQLNIGTGGSGNASAQTVDYVNAPGSIYCQNGTGNNKSCITTQPVPSAAAWPVSEGNIEAWKEQALAGGTQTGNFDAGSGSQITSLGPKKIVGNLTVGGSATLHVTGTLWVTGNLIINGSGKMDLSSAYGTASGAIIVDGTVTIAGSSPVSGSGTAGSYIMIVSLSDCPISAACSGTNAIDINGSAGAVVLVAQNGTIAFGGSAKAKQATGYRVTLSGSTIVTYETGLADMDFSSGPSGTWVVESWGEI